jgi:microsomal dipeptidase-like Zn-dependent dipeptidase
MTVRSVALTLIAAIFLLLILTLVLASKNIYRWTGVSEMAPPYRTSAQSQQLHKSMLIADLHADTATNLIDFSEPQPYGHIGRARLEAGNLSLLTLALATETTMIMNTSGGRIRGLNPIAFASMVNGWPVRTWNSNYERGHFFLDHARRVLAENSDRMFLITDREDLDRLRRAHASRPPHQLGILMAVEGIHILDGDLAKLRPLIEDGIRMISLTHGFDNEAAGSNTGSNRSALTDFGREALRIMQDSGVVLDLAHASEATISEALEIVDKPVVFSHTGIKATCDIDRNISDHAIRKLGENGGVIGVAFFTSALCGNDVDAIVSAMQHIKGLIGTEHVALGSDYDGMVKVVFDVGGLPVLTEALLGSGFSPQEIRMIMGENVIRVLSEVLPRAGYLGIRDRPNTNQDESNACCI